MVAPQCFTTPAEVAKLVRFSLSELDIENAHHEFEHLCRHLTRARICPNIIPSTGPVSSGGDQGVDFETYEVSKAIERSSFFTHAADERTVFACSLRKDYRTKIREDVTTITSQDSSVEKLTFFSNQAIPIAHRQKLAEWAQNTCKVRLDIFDLNAISELLADHEVFWIAERYLSIPSEVIFRPQEEDDDAWYQEVLRRPIDDKYLRTREFFELKDAIRFATYNEPYQSDIPKLAAKIKVFRTHPNIRLKRKAVYEEFVASLRGLGTVDGYEKDLEQYFSSIHELVDPADLEDAGCLVQFAFGALGLADLSVDKDNVLTWRRQIEQQIDKLLEEQISIERCCALLDVKGFLRLSVWMEREGGRTRTQVLADFREAASGAISVWRDMISRVEEAPMFPLERFADRLSQYIVYIGKVPGFRELVTETDNALAKRVGSYEVAVKAKDRGLNLYEADLLLDAIEEFHHAHKLFFGHETRRALILASLALSDCYSRLGLFLAAKYYALGAVFAAFKLDDPNLKKYVPRALEKVAAADYEAGASISLFNSAHTYFFAESQHSDPSRKEKQNVVEFNTMLSTFISSLVDKDLSSYLRSKLLSLWDIQDVYEQLLPTMEKQYGAKGGFAEISSQFHEQGLATPFSDLNGKRTVAWEQLGITWFLTWETNYEHTKKVEALIASLQILLCDLRHEELSILPSVVRITVRLHDGDVEIRERPSNQELLLDLLLPKKTAEKEKDQSRPRVDLAALSLSVYVLQFVTALPADRFQNSFKKRGAKGLFSKVHIIAPYESLFEQIYDKKFFDELYDHARKVEGNIAIIPVRTNPDLSGPKGLHPEYDPHVSTGIIRKRYSKIPPLIKHTLPHLLMDLKVRDVIRRLRKSEWKDWHILLAIMNIRVNYVIQRIPGSGGTPEQYAQHVNELTGREEHPSDPVPPHDLVTIQSMKEVLQIVQLNYLRELGFECRQVTPTFPAVDYFLRRFRYWDDDVPHEDFFPGLDSRPGQP